MEVSYIATNEAVLVMPVGRVDESSWEEFGTQLSRGIEQASSQSLETLIIDLSRIEYMSSRGLRVLTLAKQVARASGVFIRLASPNDLMREILAISRYDKLFPVDEALPVTDGSPT
ncbi:MAG TPA: STAS domain-containing protein [Sphingomicrobium sp.]|nr:STAS domain-containing protein [Sphingomicrobium sp.]